MSFRNHLLHQPLPTRTENGMATFMSTNDPVLDLFSHAGSMRGQNIVPLFATAFNTDPELAVRVALWLRDARGGSGQRQLFRDILNYLEKTDRSITRRVIRKVPEVGRWDDLLVLNEDYAKGDAAYLIGAALQAGNGLVAKWMPRQGTKAVELREYFGLTPKKWRKLLVNLSNTVEQQMCAQEWNKIVFDHVPSVAASRYQKAFKKNAKESYASYVEGLKKGTRTIKATTLYPYDITKAVAFGDSQVALAQWEALPNFVGNKKWLPMIDTSPSMQNHRFDNHLTAYDISVGLGLYFADKNKGGFKDVVCEFSGNARLHILQGNLLAKIAGLQKVPVDYTSTNLHAAFDELLNFAVKKNLPEQDMPDGILIFSDMQFNYCVKFDDRAFDMIKRKYAAAGYKVPKVVFWNVATRNTAQSPVTFNEKGVAVVSGFSPSIFKSIASLKNITPRDVMLETLRNSKYDF
jgi:predicted transcriptional regulator